MNFLTIKNVTMRERIIQSPSSIADHNILMQKLGYTIGIKGNALQWFQFHLHDGFNFGRVNGESSL